MVLDQDNAPFRLILTSMMNHSIRNCVIHPKHKNYNKSTSKKELQTLQFFELYIFNYHCFHIYSDKFVQYIQR